MASDKQSSQNEFDPQARKKQTLNCLIFFEEAT